jgi:DNA modification methylase
MVFIDPPYFLQLKQKKLKRWNSKTLVKSVFEDPMAGTGTTGCAAKMLKRNFVLIEKNPQYVKLIRERLSQIP